MGEKVYVRKEDVEEHESDPRNVLLWICQQIYMDPYVDNYLDSYKSLNVESFLTPKRRRLNADMLAFPWVAFTCPVLCPFLIIQVGAPENTRKVQRLFENSRNEKFLKETSL